MNEAALDRETQRRLKKAGPSPPSGSAPFVASLAKKFTAKLKTAAELNERRKALLAQLDGGKT